MFFLYQIFIFIVFLLSPIIILIRLIKKKEDKFRFLEKFCFFSQKRPKGNLLWFHAASVGELMSVIPLIHELEKNKKIKTILITTSTLSSSKIFKNFKFRKTIHQFFPIDLFYFISKFINYWKPKISIFIDSEIWPCTYRMLKRNSIPLLLLNARVTPKSFNRWKFFNKSSKNVFENIDTAYPCNLETKKFLKKFNVKNIKTIGNIKFCDAKSIKQTSFPNSFLVQTNKRLIFCASSTHKGEENIIANSHLKLRKKFKNLLTIIIPRHINRVNDINNDLQSLGLKTVIRTSKKKIDINTDIYLVDTYGETKKFLKISKIAYIGGSLINHGGQNPIEPAKFGLNILHGPNVHNFDEIYKLFNKKKIAYKINNQQQLINICSKLIISKKNNKISLKKLSSSILKKSVNEINKKFKDEIQKT